MSVIDSSLQSLTLQTGPLYLLHRTSDPRLWKTELVALCTLSSPSFHPLDHRYGQEVSLIRARESQLGKGSFVAATEYSASFTELSLIPSSFTLAWRLLRLCSS